MPPSPVQTAVITISLWRDRNDSAPVMARLLVSEDGGRPHVAAAACEVDGICEAVRAFLLLHFS